MTSLSASLEDYLEVIYTLSESDERVARSRDISERLDVAKSSVTGALRQLSDRGFVNYKPYGYVTLTEKGRKSAKIVIEKHKVLKSFFVEILGVDEETAEESACRAEHSLGEEIVSRFIRLSDYLCNTEIDGVDIKALFYKSMQKDRE